jgi:uncharacterized membrane protein YhaH (DUF805 family)
MGFTEAISSGFRNYVNFSGRAVRSEYCYWTLFAFLALIVTIIIDAAVLGQTERFPLTSLLELALLLPWLAVSVRRLHDLDRSGWWILLSFIPLIGSIILLVWNCMRGTIGPNRFGPDALGAK